MADKRELRYPRQIGAFMLSEELDDAIRAEALRQGVTVAEVIRVWLEAGRACLLDASLSRANGGSGYLHL